MLLTLSASTASFTDSTLPPTGDGLLGSSCTVVTSAGVGGTDRLAGLDGLSKSSTHAVRNHLKACHYKSLFTLAWLRLQYWYHLSCLLILSDSNNIILWHESEDINKKVYSKFSVDSNFTFTSYAQLCVIHCSIDYCVELIIAEKFLCKLLLFHTEMISAKILWGTSAVLGFRGFGFAVFETCCHLEWWY